MKELPSLTVLSCYTSSPTVTLNSSLKSFSKCCDVKALCPHVGFVFDGLSNNLIFKPIEKASLILINVAKAYESCIHSEFYYTEVIHFVLSTLLSMPYLTV